MAKIHGHVKIEIENCKGCELCVNECPQDSLKMSRNINKKGYHYAVLNDDTCTGCTNCALVCPEAIITVYRESKTIKEKITTITDLKDNISISVN
jgi:2-oxoglutarate ferredoxin oxidoreductase subunit delta